MTTLGSLFDGIGGFPWSAIRHGIQPIWASEIETWPIKVTQQNFPRMKHLGDITRINGALIEPVDIITFGSPCQDLSVAGKKAGLDGERSGLFSQAIRIIKEMRDATDGQCPRFAIWENVPGAFSSNKGQDIKTVLDELEGLGFIIDMNVLDAQFMGVPQRRRRIYALCTSADFTRQMTTPISWSIITQLLTEILLCILSDQLNLYEKEPKNSVWKQKKLTADGLQRKMKLFSIETRESFEMLLNNWIEICQIHLSEPYCSESHSEKLDTTIKAATNKNEFLTEMELEKLFGSISRSWKELLDVLYYQGNSCITLTVISETTNQIICGCANLLENMALLIGLLKDYSQNLYETELYISTARKVCIDYARERQAGITLFSGMEWVQCWDDYIRLYTETTEQLERHFGGTSAGEILFIEPCLPWNFETSGEKREKTTTDTGRSIKKSMQGNIFAIDHVITTGWNCTAQGPCVKKDGPMFTLKASGVHAISSAWRGHLAESGKAREEAAATTGDGVTEPNQAGLISAAYCHAVAHGVPVSTYWDGGQISDCLDCSMLAKGQMMPDKRRFPVVLYDMTHADDVMRPVAEGLAPTLNARMGTGGNQIPVLLGFKDYCIAGNIINRQGQNGGNGLGFRANIAYTLATNDRHAVARTLIARNDGSPCVDRGPEVVVQNYAVRRLTPLECLRLQGFPDWWLDIEGMSDTAKYRAIGNSVAIPCVDFVMSGIAEVLREGNT